MHELLDAIAHLFDSLLTPFSSAKEPVKIWVKVLGLVIGITGVLCIIALLVWGFYPA